MSNEFFMRDELETNAENNFRFLCHTDEFNSISATPAHTAEININASEKDSSENSTAGDQRSKAVNRCKEFKISDTNLFVVVKNNNYYAYENSCPHVGVPLNWAPHQFLDYDGELIHCSNHGALFLIETGRCVAGPCRGQSLKPIATRIVDDKIYIKI